MRPVLAAAQQRDRTLDALESRVFDCVVIGGGITGAGVARELGRRGLSAALLEADDFGSGTSGRSSKLIHGGLRYLAMGDVALVRETALERKVVHRLAPHLAEPCWMVVPTRSRAGLLKFRAGLGSYEKLGAVEEVDRHRVWTGEELARREPSLDRDVYPHACAYREYLTDDTRLVLANLRAAVEGGAVAASYLPVIALQRSSSSGPVDVVETRCAVTGRTLRVRGRSVVNAAGPWVGAVRRLEGGTSVSRRTLHLSKGVHLVLDRSRFAVNHLVVLGTEDRRSIFVIPRGPVVYIGTTDTSYSEGGDRWPPVTQDDVRYLLAPLERYFAFPRSATSDDVLASWAGLRPLIAQPGKAPKEISRRDEIWEGEGGVVTIAGGKLTGYRPMAIAVTRRVLGRLGRAADADVDADEGAALPGGDFEGPLDALGTSLEGVDPEVAQRLVRLYGSEASQVCALGAERVAESRIVSGEVRWAVEVEAAIHLEDFIYRRARIAWYEPRDRERLLAPLALAMGALLGWDESRREQEVRRVRERYAAELDSLSADGSCG